MTTRQEIREALERYTTAWTAGDTQAVLGCYHDDLVLHYFGQNPYAGSHVGKPAALQALGAVSRLMKRRLVRVVDLMAGDERGCVIVIEEMSGGGEPVEVERTMLYRVKDGRFIECWVQDQDQAFIDRLLNPPEGRD